MSDNPTETVTRSHTSYHSYNERFMSCPPTLTATSSSTNQEESPYNRQYSNVYNARLNELKPKCLSSFQNANTTSTTSNNDCIIVPRIIELQEDTTSFIIGTIIKNCPNKPKINFDMNQMYHEGGLSYLGVPYEKQQQGDDGVDVDVDVEPALADTTYCDITNDTIVLEDQSGRVELHFPTSDDKSSSTTHSQLIKWKLELVTGVVIGIKGKINPGSNLFDVEQIYYPTIGPSRRQEEQDNNNDDDNDDEACVLLMSGLDCGGYDYKRNSSTSLKRELVIDYITGHLNESNSQNICRIIIAGGGCSKPIRPETSSNNWSSSSSTSKSTSKSTQQQQQEIIKQQLKETTLPIRELDLFLTEICAYGIPIDIIPGLYDPTNANWPQKPIHECLVPNANSYTNMLCRVSNPYEVCIGDRVFMGSDGMNISDLRLYLGKFDETDNNMDMDEDDNKNETKEKEVVTVSNVEALESSLKYNHMVPTGPDSVPTFPFDKNDPFVIQHVPDIYFCGNCESFESKMVTIQAGTGSSSDGGSMTDEKVRLICIPSFAKTGQVVLLKLKSLECTVIEFDDVVVDDDNDDGTGGDVIDEKKVE